MGARADITMATGRQETNPAGQIFASLRHRNFRLFFTGQLISLIGSWMQNTAQGWLVVLLAAPGVALGGTAAAAGSVAEANASLYLSLVAAANSLPVLLGSLYGGVIADRFSKRTIIIATQAAQGLLALAMSALIFYGHIAVWQVILFALLIGVTNIFDVPARQAFVVEMVGKEDLANAIALNSSLFNAARAIGPAVAGLLLAILAGIPEETALAICFLINGLSYIAVIWGLWLMRGDFSAREDAPVSPLEATREVFSYLKDHHGTRILIWMVAGFSLAAVPYWTLIPSLAKFVLHADARQFGLLLSAQGIGALIGALLVAARAGGSGKGVVVTGAFIAFPTFMFMLSQSHNYWVSLVLIMCCGFAAIIFLANANALVQTSTPDHLRGRIMGLYSLLLMGLTPVGSLWSSAVAKFWGGPAALATGAVFLLICGVTVVLRFPNFRRMDHSLPKHL